MKKYLILTAVLFFAVCLFACGRKKDSLEELQEPMSMEALSMVGNDTVAPPEANAPAQANPEVAQGVPVATTELATLPPQGPYKPTVQEIQTTLKNAGFYTGVVDGKVGPMTKKAIQEFQKANGLQADGKVGPMTWEVLSKYLNPPAGKQQKR